MGILDDAIREHLELKRQHGAQNDDLERLEKEAFGPLTRPGDPEFPDSRSEPDAIGAESGAASSAAGGDPPAAEAGDGQGGLKDWFSDEEETRVLSREPEPEAQAPFEGADLGDTVAHPAPAEPVEAEPVEAEPVEAAAEPAAPGEAPAPPSDPPEAPERAIFDAEDIDFGELDIELDSRPGEPAPSHSGAHLAPDPSRPDEGDDDLDLDLPDDSGAEREADLIEDDEDAPPLPIRPQGEDAGEEGGEDLLEETPDFLQDAPEGERLWFEQGAPKDFDFDEDD